jgi:NADPH:quinone reductase-like Zn-dependent oxidoreductase
MSTFRSPMSPCATLTRTSSGMNGLINLVRPHTPSFRVTRSLAPLLILALVSPCLRLATLSGSVAWCIRARAVRNVGNARSSIAPAAAGSLCVAASARPLYSAVSCAICSSSHICGRGLSICVLRSTLSVVMRLSLCYIKHISYVASSGSGLDDTVMTHCVGDVLQPDAGPNSTAQAVILAMQDARRRDDTSGLSTHIVVREDFVLRLPRKLHMAGAAPLLCAGITAYSALQYYGADTAGQKVAVIGLGGLCHLAVKFAKAFQDKVTVLSRSSAKEENAIISLGADHFLVTSDSEALKGVGGTFVFVVDTVSAQHDLGPLIALLKVGGTLIMLGLPPKSVSFNPFTLIFKRTVVGGSVIGSIKETQEMLDFCVEHDITCQHELIPADYVNKAAERIVAGDVKYRCAYIPNKRWV